MKKSYPKTSPEWQLFNDIWGILKDFGVIEENESYWDELQARFKVLYKKYQGSSYAKDLIMATVEEFQRKSKG